jgi:hypothetical protein
MKKFWLNIFIFTFLFSNHISAEIHRYEEFELTNKSDEDVMVCTCYKKQNSSKIECSSNDWIRISNETIKNFYRKMIETKEDKEITWILHSLKIRKTNSDPAEFMTIYTEEDGSSFYINNEQQKIYDDPIMNTFYIKGAWPKYYLDVEQ